MTLIVGLTSTGTGTRYDLTTLDDIIVGRDSFIVSTNDTAINGTGSNHEVTVEGLVHSALYGVRLGDSRTDDSNQIVIIRPGGSVGAATNFGTAGVLINGANSAIFNEGSISGYNGIAMGAVEGVTLGLSTIANRGTIYGADDGITRFGSDTQALLVHNTGLLQGGVRAFNDNGSNAIETIRNRGEIVGDIFVGAGDDTVDNRDGSIEGDVDLGAGADVYTGANGTIYGTVFGGIGADRFTGNANMAEDFDGGADLDTLDFRMLGAVVVSLDGSLANAGSAAGDTYIGFENVNGSNAGSDHILGNAAANVINGLGGNDTLGGGGGADNLRGGTGLDVMTGGLGNDTFRFLTFADFGDQITDFSSNAAGDNDRFMLTAADLGGGLAAGTLAAAQFQSRADNLAQDADDRFIFRTTDRTLWFDVDGNGSDAAVMVADLQAGATMTALDILLI